MLHFLVYKIFSFYINGVLNCKGLMSSEILSSKTTLLPVKITSDVKKFLSLSNSMQQSCSLDKISRSIHHKFPAIYYSRVYTSLDLIFSQFIPTNKFI